MVTGVLVTVTNTATKIVEKLTGENGRGSCIQNVSDVDVFIGGTGVTTSAYGHKLLPGAALSIDLSRGDAVYGVVASGSKSVAVLTAGL